MKKQELKYEEIKKGCIYPLIGFFGIIFLVAVISVLFNKCDAPRYSPSTIHTVDQSQTNEMRSYHSDKGLVVAEDGLMIIKK